MNKQFDYETRDLIGEIKYGLRAVPFIRSAVLQLADALSKQTGRKGFLLLVDSHVSVERIASEWETLQRILNPDIANRLAIYLKQGDEFRGWPEDPGEGMAARLLSAAPEEPGISGMRLPKADYFSVILKTLLLDWLGQPLKKPGVMTMKRLGELAGCSYPTTASAVNRLKPYLKRTNSKGIHLRRFPEEEWHAMILGADKIRTTQRLVDRSGQPRRPKFLLDRLAVIQNEKLAVGGVAGAMAAFPDLNITGYPRLDICIHAPGKFADIKFVRKLDPALEPANSQTEPAQLVLHFVRSKYSYFEQGFPGIQRASWVECMLDLHEIRLGAQADEWLHHKIRERGAVSE